MFWFLLPSWLWMLRGRKIQPQPLPISALFIIKAVRIRLFEEMSFRQSGSSSKDMCRSLSQVFTILFLVVQIIRLVNFILLKEQERSEANLISAVSYTITSLTILWLMNYDRRKGMFCSGLLFGFWLLVCLCMIPNVINYVVEYKHQVSDPQSANGTSSPARRHFHTTHSVNSLEFGSISFSHWARSLPIVSLNHTIFPRWQLMKGYRHQHYILSAITLVSILSPLQPIAPELYVNFPSRITYWWVTPLILRGYKKPLTEEDCWKLQVSEQVGNVVHRVQACLEGCVLTQTVL